MSPLTFHTFAPAWGLPSASPFCMKLEIWLRMAEIPYKRSIPSGPPKSKSGKMPYVVLDDGTQIEDSRVIIETLTQKFDIQLDAHLSAEQQALGHVIQRTLEESTYFAIVRERWIDPGNFSVIREKYFEKLPWVLKPIVPVVVRRGIGKSLHGQGVGRLPEPAFKDVIQADIAALSHLLGEKDYVLGTLSSVDAVVFSFLQQALSFELKNCITKEATQRHPNLVAYCERMKTTWIDEWDQSHQ